MFLHFFNKVFAFIIIVHAHYKIQVNSEKHKKKIVRWSELSTRRNIKAGTSADTYSEKDQIDATKFQPEVFTEYMLLLEKVFLERKKA